MSNNNVISSNDPNAVEKLIAKKEACQQLQETMKEVNAHWRRTGTCIGAPGITEEQAKKIDNRIVNSQHFWDRVPFSDYSLKNNNAEIKRLDKRIAEVTHFKEVGFSGWEFEGGRAEANTEQNRLQLCFDEKPSDGQRSQLKSHGFKWTPSQGVWQRQLTENAIYAAGRLDFIKPTDGRSVREHQPKASVRNAEAR
jgi:hypothetical protein